MRSARRPALHRDELERDAQFDSTCSPRPSSGSPSRAPCGAPALPGATRSASAAPSFAATATSAALPPAPYPICTSARARRAGTLVALKVARDRQDEQAQPVDAVPALPAGIRDRPAHRQPRSRAPLRSGRERRARLAGHGVFRARATCARRMRAGAQAARGPALRGRDRPRAAGDARRRRAAPRSQARQRHAARGRQHRAHRFRPVEGCRAGARHHRHAA